MDVDALHALTLNTKNAESSVTVNQRALIDKVLSRYSSENTLLRELLQNSDDANATSVRITYESSKKSSPISTAQPEDFSKRLTRRVIVKNNGQTFRPEDWSRLSRIAEGNPDEAKIGAFGVGFYSVFSICEDPFVTSGDTAIAFYWRNDQLFTRTATLPTKDAWTSFSLNMRQEIELPNLKSLTKFLATSLTFSRSLAVIELWLDDLELCVIKRVTSGESALSIPPSLATTTSGNVFKITGLETASVQIQATYLEATQVASTASSAGSKFFSFFSVPKTDTIATDLSRRTTSTIFLRVLTGSLTSTLKSSFSAELQRATKKPPPKQTKIQLVIVNAAEYAASTVRAQIFENLLTFPNQGRIYIGFPTHQTTGFAGHVGAPCVIPTVERESIDLVDRFIKIWNFEVLRAIGLLTRMAYHIEFQNVKTLDEAIHTMKYFSMKPATPQSINQTVEPTFFQSSTSLPIWTSQKVQLTEKTRLPDARVKFLKAVPILADEIQQELPGFVDRLKQLGYIETISIGDIKRDLQDRVLDVTDGVVFLRYCASISNEIDRMALDSLLKSGLIDGGHGAAPINAGLINSFADSKSLPSNAPLPSTCIPLSFSSSLSTEQMRQLGWQEITVLEWLRFVVDLSSSKRLAGQDLSKDPDFAILVLSVISKGFDAMKTDDRAQVMGILKERTCIPTKSHGMRRPDQTYFHTIKLFEDLPLILTMKGVKERFLVALGVRRTIELDLLFDKLASDGNWSAYDVIAYLTSVRKEIPAKDMERLRTIPFAKAEGLETRMPLNQLYEPTDALRMLSLPIITWPKGKWKTFSNETEFLHILGLQKYPSSSTLVRLASNASDLDLRERALGYFLLNFISHDYGATYNSSTTLMAFVPTESGNLGRPTEVYANPACAIFGFQILRKDLVDRATILGVSPNPSPGLLMGILLREPPKSHSAAMAQFQYIARVQPNLTKTEKDQMFQREFIPVERNGKLVRLTSPSKCFFRNANVDPVYLEIFDFVDFGLHGNQFLRAVGVRDEPSTSQIAGMLVKDATTVWTICGGEQRYILLLRQIARDIANVKKDRHLFESMKQAMFLVCHKYIESSKVQKVQNGNADDLMEQADHGVQQTSLQKASQIMIADDVVDFELFRTDVFTCPQESVLEELYSELGCLRLSSTILDRPVTNGRQLTNEFTIKLKIDLLERLSVMLSDQSIRRKSNARNLVTSLSIVMQEKVSLQRALRFGSISVSKLVQVTALIRNEGSSNILVIAQKPDIYDVAVAVCKLVLTSPKPGNYLLLESMLTNSLRTLKARGYNVDRILQKQEQDKKERQLQQDAADRQAAIEAEKAKEEAHVDQAKDIKEAPSIGNVTVPGAYPATPKSTNPPEQPSNLFSNIKRGLGLGKPNQAYPNPTPALRHTSPEIAEQSVEHNLPSQGQQIEANPRPGQGVTSQASINQTLEKAIRLTRSSDDHSVFSQGRYDQVAEAKSFCDATPAQNLIFAATLQNGYKFFLNRALDQSATLHRTLPSAKRFSELLGILGEIFGVNRGALNVCYDDSGPTIAFNKSGTIYCNLHFFSSLHDISSSTVTDVSGRKRDAMMYWFVTLAHELAHNLVSEHSSEHEFYMESMVIAYLPQLMAILNQQQQLPAGMADLPSYTPM